MNRASWTLFLTALLIVFPWGRRGISQTPGQAGQEAALFLDTTPPPGATVAAPAYVLRQRWVTINFDRIRDTLIQGAAGSLTLLLNLFPDARFVAVLDRVEQTATGYVGSDVCKVLLRAASRSPSMRML
jgi:hypothetical protein